MIVEKLQVFVYLGFFRMDISVIEFLVVCCFLLKNAFFWSIVRSLVIISNRVLQRGKLCLCYLN